MGHSHGESPYRRGSSPSPTMSEEEEERSLDEERSDQTEEIIKTGSVTPAKGKHVIHCLTIVGQVEGHQLLPGRLHEGRAGSINPFTSCLIV